MSNQEQKPEETPAPLPSKDTGGFCSVAHPIFRHWMAILSGDAFQALCHVIDRTWGFQEQIASISLSDFKRAMGIPSKHDEKVYRALRELFFFKLIAESSVKGKQGKKAYFVTLVALNTTNTVLVVQEGRWYVKMNATTNPTLVELLTLREEIHSHPVSSGPNRVLVDKQSLFARQAAHEEARRKAKQRAKDMSLKKSSKDTLKDIPPSATLQAGAPNVAPLVVEEQESQEETTTGEADMPTIPLEPARNTMQASEPPRRSREVAPRTAELSKEADEIAARWWGYVKTDMHALVSAGTWDSWFPATRGLRLEGRTLVVYVPKGAQEQMEHRFAGMIASILEQRARPGLIVRYTQEEG